MDKYQSISALLAACAIVACANGQVRDEDSMSNEEQKPDVKRLTAESVPTAVGEVGAGKKGTGQIGPGLQQLVDRATADLMAKMSVAEDAIEVVEAAYVTWPDSAMGCAKPGYQYLQVLTNGSRIVLRANNKTYHYHSGKSYPPFLCENPTVKNPPPYAPGEA